jgi:dTDP-4-amino-4,6-dideoxygalactose transaminase
LQNSTIDFTDQVLNDRVAPGPGCPRWHYRYRELLRSSGLRLLEFDETQKTSYKNIVVELTGGWPLTRAETLEILHAEGALARPYYAPPLHRKSMSYPYVPVTLPVTDRLAEIFMLLPCGHFVSEADIDALCGLLAFIEQNAGAIRDRWQA